MRVQHVAGDLFVDFRLEVSGTDGGYYDLEGAIQVRDTQSDNPGLSIHAVALGIDAVKSVIAMVENEEWKKHFAEVDDGAGN